MPCRARLQRRARPCTPYRHLVDTARDQFDLTVGRTAATVGVRTALPQRGVPSATTPLRTATVGGHRNPFHPPADRAPTRSDSAGSSRKQRCHMQEGYLPPEYEAVCHILAAPALRRVSPKLASRSRERRRIRATIPSPSVVIPRGEAPGASTISSAMAGNGPARRLDRSRGFAQWPRIRNTRQIFSMASTWS